MTGPEAELSAAHLRGEAGHGTQWRVIAHRVRPATVLVTARAAARHTAEALRSPVAGRRALAKELRDQGWRCDRGWLAQATAPTVTWTSPDTGISVVWTAPGSRGVGGWQITGERLLVTAHPHTPTEVLRQLATA